ncbi:hypothetical protein RND81_02G108500 [Saponaria officinalis]|uniref:Uncharacterized protein n=1 Tax=Saponaria officinalis TaxID=3572 RepID=A0AAW1MM21_SAPOF
MYQQYMRYSNIRNFKDLNLIGTRIEDDLRQGTMAKILGQGYQGSSSRSTPSSSKTEEIHSINVLDTLAASASEPNPKRTFDPFYMSYAKALQRLVKQDYLKLLGPTPEPPGDKRSHRWDVAAYCDYHRGKGHSTEECFKLKHAIQDMIDSGKLPKPKGPPPSNNDNPLGNHAIFVGSIPIIDCSRLIIPTEPQINGVWASDDDDDWPPVAQINKASYSALPHKYDKKWNKNKSKGKADDEVSHLTRSGRSYQSPLIINEPTEAPQNKTASNNDKGKAVVEEVAVPVPPPPAGATSSGTTATTPSATLSDTEDVLHKQLLKTKSDISVW